MPFHKSYAQGTGSLDQRVVRAREGEKKNFEIGKSCVGKSPADFRSIWGSPLDFDRAGVSKGTGPNLVNVFIPEAAPRGKPQGLAVEINTNKGTCLKLNDRLE